MKYEINKNHTALILNGNYYRIDSILDHIIEKYPELVTYLENIFLSKFTEYNYVNNVNEIIQELDSIDMLSTIIESMNKSSEDGLNLIADELFKMESVMSNPNYEVTLNDISSYNALMMKFHQLISMDDALILKYGKPLFEYLGNGSLQIIPTQQLRDLLNTRQQSNGVDINMFNLN